MISLSRRYRSTRQDTGDFMPPNVRSLGAVPFAAPQRKRLDSWLAEAGWQRGHMESAELEGYLVALIAWPVAISSGAWLPPVWGERGWKVPTKLSARPKFEEFVGLIVGLMQDLDRQLSLQTSRFESSVLRRAPDHGHGDALNRWGHGFMAALKLDSQGLKWRGEDARSAVSTIAKATASPVQFHAKAVEDIATAVRALMTLRANRGPLGALDAMAPVEFAPHSLNPQTN